MKKEIKEVKIKLSNKEHKQFLKMKKVKNLTWRQILLLSLEEDVK